MTSTMNNVRPAMLLTALLVAIAAFAFNTQAAAAQCCNINIRNASECRFEACLRFYSGQERCVVILPGGNNFDVPDCPGYRLVVTDICGTVHHFPTIPGTAIYVRTSAGCCLRIYLASECCWEVTPAPIENCAPCHY